ncbi:MAG: FAD-dependent oxidoreductase [Thalassobaculales bacterium]
MKQTPLAASLWAETAPPPPPLGSLIGPADSDVAIVGGGFTGLSAALHLAERGVAVTLLEAGEIGEGASGRNNGQVIPHYIRHAPSDIERLYGPARGGRLNAMIRDAASFVFDLARRHGIDCDAVQKGWFQPAHRPSRLARSQRLAREWAERGAAVDYLDAGRAREMLGGEGYHGGWVAHAGGHLNPLAFARGLAAAALCAGASLHIRTPVSAIEAKGAGWRLKTPAGDVSARHVLLATNAYGGDLWPGLRRTILPVRVFQVATRPLGGNLRGIVLPGDQAMSDTRTNLRYARYARGGRLVIGGNLLSWHSAENRAKESRAAMLAELFPPLAGIGFDHYWEGYVGVVPERLPRLVRLAKGVVAAMGYSGRGVAFATALGPVLADWLTGTPDDALPLPVAAPRPIPAYPVARAVARLMPLVNRWQDGRD